MKGTVRHVSVGVMMATILSAASTWGSVPGRAPHVMPAKLSLSHTVSPTVRPLMTVLAAPHPVVRAAAESVQNVMYYGLGWNGSQGVQGAVPVTPFVNPEPQTWTTTPCMTLFGHRVCSGTSAAQGFQTLSAGISGAAVIAGGIADQGIENWIWAPYTAPSPGSTVGGGNWVATVHIQAQVDTILLANNLGALSDVGTDILQANANLPTLGQTSRNLGVGAYVDIDASFLSGSEAANAADDIAQSNLPAFLAIAQSALQNTVTNDLASLQAPPTTSFQAAAQTLNNLLSAVSGGSTYHTTFDQTLSLPAGQSVLIGFAPELMVANAGLGVTGALAVSFVQLKVTGTAQLQGTPTTIQVSPAHSQGLPYSFGVTSWLLPITVTTDTAVPVANVPVTVTLPNSDGVRQTWDCTTDNSGLCQLTIGATTPEPGPTIPLTISFAGNSQYLSSSTTVNITEKPGFTQATLHVEASRLTPQGIPAGATVMLTGSVSPAVPTASWGGLAPLGHLEFLANGSVIGTCSLRTTSAGAQCATTWTPTVSQARESVTLQAVWAGNLDWNGAQSTPVTVSVYRPGVWLTVAAHGPAVGSALVCRPGLPQSCHIVSYGSRSNLVATVYRNGAPTDGGYTVHFAIQGHTVAQCQTFGPSCRWTYVVQHPPQHTVPVSIVAWVTGPRGHAYSGASAAVTLTDYAPTWSMHVTPTAVMTFNGVPVGLGPASSGQVWVWLASRYASPDPSQLWLVSASTHRVVGRLALGEQTPVYTIGPDGLAWYITTTMAKGSVGEQLVARPPQGPAREFALSAGFDAEAVAAGPHVVWVVGIFRTGRVGGNTFPTSSSLTALAFDPASGLLRATVRLPHSAQLTTDSWLAAADNAGLWVATQSQGHVYWVTPQAVRAWTLRSPAFSGLAIDGQGGGWLWGYGSEGAGTVWPIAANGQLGEAGRSYGPTVNMVTQGVAVNNLGMGYLPFSALGGGHGLAGVAVVTPTLQEGLTLLPLGTMPGGGVGVIMVLPNGTVWATEPYSHAVFILTPTA